MRSKRQKLEPLADSVVDEALRNVHPGPVSQYTPTVSLRAQVQQEGLLTCYVDDRMICMYCNLPGSAANKNIDNPVSSPVPFLNLSSAPISHDHQAENQPPRRKLPVHPEFIDPERRRESFPNESNRSDFLKDVAATAGFFFSGVHMVCFYCSGSLDGWQGDVHPLAEHVQRFPHCTFARGLCGERFHRQLQRPSERVQSVGSLMSEIVLNVEKCHEPIVQQCWTRHLQIYSNRSCKPVSFLFSHGSR